METEITAIIVDDIQEQHELLEAFLRAVAPHVRIVGNAVSLRQAEDLIKKLSPMLLFLDIQFNDEKETAFDLLQKFSRQGKCDFQVIIMTAFSCEEYYAEAFNLGVLHFLPKPFGPERLKVAVDRACKNIDHTQLYLSPAPFRHFPKSPDKITIESLNCTEVVLMNDIVYLEASGRYTYIYTNLPESRSICSSVNLGGYGKKLQSFPEFCRIHRKMIVNTNYVLRFSKKDRSITLTLPFKKQYASKEGFKEFTKLMDTQRLIL